MEKRTLGKTGISVSRLCFGSLTMGPLQANFDAERAGEVMAYAFSRGVNFVDMAQLYGVYPHVKAALRRVGSEIIIASKTYAYEYDAAMQAVEECRRALDRDVIDIFCLHEQESIYTLQGHAKALEALYDCKARGIIRAVGASMHHVAAVEGAIQLGLDVIHPLINVAGWGIVDGTREQMEDAASRAHEAGIGVYTMKSFGGGNLHKRSGECLRYSLSLPFADSVAVGMQSEGEADANISFFECGSFTPDEERYLTEKKRRLHIEDWCTGCGECAKHCPQGASHVENGRLTVDRQKCVLCSYCSAFCEMYAIKVL